ncbi:hypothetical protein C5E45_20250 [Nocardia nova]|uniref:Uncharacterized protein n=1 Tax=Nocardia nova TaxID=37330 RepID=A0A2S6AMC2_9NOCA|nr:hypothetical protein C5E45_20250 [Nocardia nova]
MVGAVRYEFVVAGVLSERALTVFSELQVSRRRRSICLYGPVAGREGLRSVLFGGDRRCGQAWDGSFCKSRCQGQGLVRWAEESVAQSRGRSSSVRSRSPRHARSHATSPDESSG